MASWKRYTLGLCQSRRKWIVVIVVDGKQVWVVGTLPAVEASGRRGDV